jgi:hypothetical protein
MCAVLLKKTDVCSFQKKKYKNLLAGIIYPPIKVLLFQFTIMHSFYIPTYNFINYCDSCLAPTPNDPS